MSKHGALKLWLIACVQLFAASNAFAGQEDFYWKASYGRGIGTVPKGVCGAQEEDAGLCYAPCKAGYHGVGPVCWNNDKPSYGRGAGKVPHAGGKCSSGMEKDTGLCYHQC